MAKQACKKCGRLLTGESCPICKDSKLSKSWKGRIIILNPESSELAKKIRKTEAGEYALRI